MQDLDEEDRQRITSRLDTQHFTRKRRLNPVKASLRRVGDAFNGSKTYAREKVSIPGYSKANQLCRERFYCLSCDHLDC